MFGHPFKHGEKSSCSSYNYQFDILSLVHEALVVVYCEIQQRALSNFNITFAYYMITCDYG